MAGDELVRCIAITMLAPAFGERVFLFFFEHREPPDIVQIARAGLLSYRRQLSPLWKRPGIGVSWIFCRSAINAHIGSSSTAAGIKEETDGSGFSSWFRNRSSGGLKPA
jgi:hypothetical protein